jgi:hypothetical protein
LDSAKRKQEMEKIQEMFQKAKAYGDDKVTGFIKKSFILIVVN